MFLHRRKPTTPNSEPSIWNGWTERLITTINGQDQFTFQLTYFSVTNDFDSLRYAHAVRMADQDLENYDKMPMLFSDVPNGIPNEGYVQINGLARGKEIRTGVRCNLNIVYHPLLEIALKEEAGWIVLTSEDPVFGTRGEGREFTTPTIHGVLYDPDCTLIQAIRQSFAAAAARGGLPEIRLLLNDKIGTGVEEFVKSTEQSYKIKAIITWETWGTERGY